MEKTTKKRKKSKRLKRRIGLIAIGGLSVMLTVCLSVGATLAWFAGSTWASNDMYMGGPVYVEMAGRGENTYAGQGPGDDNNALNNAVWKGGAGQLDIVASRRSSGTKDYTSSTGSTNILLPGQKLLIYSQARVFSTLEKSTAKDHAYADKSSGSDNSNVSDGTHAYYDKNGRVQTTTTSVLRAKFSINIEFDPAVGFNNFTDESYVAGYPVQSSNYIGDVGDDVTPDVAAVSTPTAKPAEYYFSSALGATAYSHTRTDADSDGTYVITSKTGRRDAVAQRIVDVNKDTTLKTGSDGKPVEPNEYINTSDDVDYWVDGSTQTELEQIKDGISKSIYKWKYVSKAQYTNASEAAKMGKPFDGSVNTAGGVSAEAYLDPEDTSKGKGTGNGFYGIWILDSNDKKTESDAFFKARRDAYMKSYVEHYVDDYDRDLVLQIGTSLDKLESALNESFVKLVNQSSDNIIAGRTGGFDATTDGSITYDGDDENMTNGTAASWLYVDPTIGNDTNAADSSTSVGGWWYLVSSDTGSVTSGANKVNTVVDYVSGVSSVDVDPTSKTYGNVVFDFEDQVNNSVNAPGASKTKYPDAKVDPDGEGQAPAATILSDTFQRADTSTPDGSKLADTDTRILNAKLFEITPNFTDQVKSTNPDGTTVTKVVSISFPFVNGNFELPTRELTNVFANAKISFQITFQALQAFFPFATSIDGLASGSALAGTGKALNIGNAIPIYNEAFDYMSYLDVE